MASPPAWERRRDLPADELSPDILVLLVSCGLPVRKTDSEAVKEAFQGSKSGDLGVV